jgi:hypothetical protein
MQISSDDISSALAPEESEADVHPLGIERHEALTTGRRPNVPSKILIAQGLIPRVETRCCAQTADEDDPTSNVTFTPAQ